MKNYLNFETEIKDLENELDRLKDHLMTVYLKWTPKYL